MKSMPHYTTFDGCAYGLKSSDGKPMNKTWKIASTHERIKGFLNNVSVKKNMLKFEAMMQRRQKDTQKKSLTSQHNACWKMRFI